MTCTSPRGIAGDASSSMVSDQAHSFLCRHLPLEFMFSEVLCSAKFLLW